jgi:hypothetical protein
MVETMAEETFREKSALRSATNVFSACFELHKIFRFFIGLLACQMGHEIFPASEYLK